MADGSTPVVRIRRSDDIKGCAAVLREVYATDGYPVEGVTDAEAWLFPDGLLEAWVAVDSGQILGHAAICEPRGEDAAEMLIEQTGISEREIAVVARLFVAPAARGRSLGQALAAAAMEYATVHDLRVVFDVMTKDHAAIRLYERLGCIRLGTAVHKFGEGQEVEAYCYVAPGAMPSTR
jgi:ribosomal protein S18 acetylase RimI-like enzyme